MSRLHIQPIPRAIHPLLALLQWTMEESLPSHDVMRIMVRCLFDDKFTERDALDELQVMLRPENATAEGISKLATCFGKLLAVLEESFYYQRMVHRKSRMAVLYVPMGADFAVITNPIEVLTALDTMRSINETLTNNDLVYRVEVPAGFNQLIAAGAKGADKLLQKVIAAKLSGERIPTASERGYTDKEAQVYDDAVSEIHLILAHNYFNLVKPGWYDYRVEYPSDWEVIIIYSRKHAKLELVKSEIDPDEKEPA